MPVPHLQPLNPSNLNRKNPKTGKLKLLQGCADPASGWPQGAPCSQEAQIRSNGYKLQPKGFSV